MSNITHKMYILSKAQKDIAEGFNVELEKEYKKVQAIQLQDTYKPTAEADFPGEDFSEGVFALPARLATSGRQGIDAYLQGLTSSEVSMEYFPKDDEEEIIEEPIDSV